MTDYKKWDKFVDNQCKFEGRDDVVQEFRDSNSKIIASKMSINEKVIADAMKSSEILDSQVSIEVFCEISLKASYLARLQNAVNALKAQKGNRRNRKMSEGTNLISSDEVRNTNTTLVESLRFVSVFMNNLLKEVQFLHVYTEKVLVHLLNEKCTLSYCFWPEIKTFVWILEEHGLYD
jgi:hypothetical protein